MAEESNQHTVIFPSHWGDALFPALIEYRDAVYICKTCGADHPAFVCGVCNDAWCGKCEGTHTTPLGLQKIVSDSLAGTRVNDLYYEMRCCYACKLAKRIEACQPGRPSAFFTIKHPHTGALLPFVRGMNAIQGRALPAPTAVHAGTSIVCPCHPPIKASTEATAEPQSTSSEEDYSAAVELLPAPQPPGMG